MRCLNDPFMAIDTKVIGKIQISTGIVLLLLTTIFFVFIVKIAYFDNIYKKSISETGKIWSELDQEYKDNLSDRERNTNTANMLSFLYVEAGVGYSGLLNLIVSGIILLSLSIMMVLQGLSNINKRK